MKVYEFLNSISEINPQSKSGRRGLNNKITSVELIEETNSTEWLREGALVFASSAQFRKDEGEQMILIQKLIRHQVSGLVLTSHLEQSIYKSVLDYADFYNLPIIEIAENTSYDTLLSPLYKQRFKAKANPQAEVNKNQYDFFYLKNYTEIEDALNDLSDVIESPVYIEDEKGRLLYTADKEVDDGWRKSRAVFSPPAYADFKSTIKTWQLAFKSVFYTDFIYTNQRRRVVLPLNNADETFAFIHLTYETNEKRRELTVQQLTRIKDKLYLVMMRELVDLQHQRVKDDVYLRQRKLKENEAAYLIHFDLARTILDYKRTDKLDYFSIIEKYLKKYLKELKLFDEVTIFERDDKFFAFIIRQKRLDKLVFEKKVEALQSRARIQLNRLILSTPFKDLSEITRKEVEVLTVKEIIQAHDSKDKFICYYEDIGFYNYLMILKNETDVSYYVREVLGVLIEAKNEDLLETLETYINERGNVTRVAEKLYLQRRTITYRLKRITELLNIDLNKAEDLFLLQFSLKLYKLEK